MAKKFLLIKLSNDLILIFMNTEKQIFYIPSDCKSERIDIYLTQLLPAFSRTQIQKLIKDKHITIKNRPIKANYKIHSLDQIEIYFPPLKKSEILPENIPLDIYYEDEHLLVVNKSAEMVVHPAPANFQGTLVNALLYHCKSLSGIGGVQRPGIVHRLDKNTSGLMVVAKDDAAHHGLAEQFAARTTEREYRALVWGHPGPRVGRIETHLSRSQKNRLLINVCQPEKGRHAITNYEVLDEFHLFSFLKLKLETGRTHQIRVHLKYIGHPVFGDPVYGGRQKKIAALNQNDREYVLPLLHSFPHQALHALTLGFQHPIKNEYMRFESVLPAPFQNLLDKTRTYTV